MASRATAAATSAPPFTPFIRPPSRCRRVVIIVSSERNRKVETEGSSLRSSAGWGSAGRRRRLGTDTTERPRRRHRWLRAENLRERVVAALLVAARGAADAE